VRNYFSTEIKVFSSSTCKGDTTSILMMNKTTTKAGRRIDPSGWKREKREINKHLKADKGLLTELFLIVVLSYHMHRKGSHNVASRAQSISRVNKARRARERTQKQREANCHYKNNYDHQLRLLAYKFTHEEQQERKNCESFHIRQFVSFCSPPR
jgi:hypothetical protein